MIKTSFNIHLLGTELSVFESEKHLKQEQMVLKLGPVNKSGCYKVNNLAAFPISSLWRGLRFYIWITIQAQALVVFWEGERWPRRTTWGYFLVERIKLWTVEKIRRSQAGHVCGIRLRFSRNKVVFTKFPEFLLELMMHKSFQILISLSSY